jgi:hypothetical protein
LGKVILFDRRVRPYPPHQFVFGEHPTVLLDKNQQSIKNLGLQRNGYTIPQQKAILSVQAKRSELI